MDIIGAMAVATATTDRHHFVQRASVAFCTDDTDMRACKRKARLYVMVECPNVPGNGVVTGIAAIMEIAVMWVFLTVAGSTVTFLVAEGLCLMAILALILVVHAKERESSKVVIEKYRVLPLNFCVATSATRSQRPFVCIVV